MHTTTFLVLLVPQLLTSLAATPEAPHPPTSGGVIFPFKANPASCPLRLLIPASLSKLFPHLISLSDSCLSLVTDYCPHVSPLAGIGPHLPQALEIFLPASEHSVVRTRPWNGGAGPRMGLCLDVRTE